MDLKHWRINSTTTTKLNHHRHVHLHQLNCAMHAQKIKNIASDDDIASHLLKFDESKWIQLMLPHPLSSSFQQIQLKKRRRISIWRQSILPPKDSTHSVPNDISKQWVVRVIVPQTTYGETSD
eukprot:951595_1